MAVSIGVCFYRDRKLYKLGLKGFYIRDDDESTGKIIVRYDVVMRGVSCVWVLGAAGPHRFHVCLLLTFLWHLSLCARLVVLEQLLAVQAGIPQLVGWLGSTE